ncbi:MAG: class IV adenylate cyclase [Candidatus Bathyarchaeota archaeon]|nr:class IV adenylate cyclase [Candidatus Bathyarchaeota archaeon]
MREIEVKILNVNKHKIKETFAKLGAKQVFDGKIETLFFDFEDGSIAKRNSVLRVRKEGNRATLTFKKVVHRHGAKVAEEHTVDISDFQQIKMILESVGLLISASMQKHRTSYQLNDVHFDIDTYQGKYSYISPFLEIEAKNAETIYKYANLLGYKAEDCLPWTIKELIDYYSH